MLGNARRSTNLYHHEILLDSHLDIDPARISRHAPQTLPSNGSIMRCEMELLDMCKQPSKREGCSYLRSGAGALSHEDEGKECFWSGQGRPRALLGSPTAHVVWVKWCCHKYCIGWHEKEKEAEARRTLLVEVTGFGSLGLAGSTVSSSTLMYSTARKRNL